MSLRSIAILVVLGAVLAGCADRPPSVATPTPSAALGAPLAFQAVNDGSGCVEAIGILLVTPAQAQKSLPAGWKAADAQVLLGTPMPTGSGAVWFSGFSCQTDGVAGGPLNGGEFGILVQPPTLSDGMKADGSVQVYLLTKASDSPAEQALLNGTGFPLRMDNITVRTGLRAPVPAPVPSAPVPGAGSVTVGDRTAPFYSLRFQALPSQPLTAKGQFWSQTATGLVLYEYNVDGVVSEKGAVTSCTFGEGLPKDVAGTASCAPADALVLIAPEQKWTGSVSWMPGVHAV